MKRTGLADSPFFHLSPHNPHSEGRDETGAEEQRVSDTGEEQTKSESAVNEASSPVAERDTTVSRHHDTETPRDHETTTPRDRDTIEAVRRAVKEVGKEAATHRFTVEEKRAVAKVIFAYSQQGVRTSENEIARIAINYLLEDYEQHGERSVLARVLRELNE